MYFNITIANLTRLLIVLPFLLTACSKKPQKRDKEFYKDLVKSMKGDAVCLLGSVNDSKASGKAVFITLGDPIEERVGVGLEVNGMEPGKHALHLHEFGTCGNNASDAGGHWNPTNSIHGDRGIGENFHEGDIVNIEVDSDGKGFWYGEVKGWTIGEGYLNDIIQKAMVIHAKQDDFISQPSGNAGTRIACGVIEPGNPD